MIYVCISALKRHENLVRLLSDKYWESVKGEDLKTLVVFQDPDMDSVDPIIQYLNGRTLLHLLPTNLGCAGSRKLSVHLAYSVGIDRGDIFVFLDDDCIIDSDQWLPRLLAPLENPRVGISGVDGRMVTADYMTIPVARHETLGCHPDYVSGGRCAIRSEVFFSGCEFDVRFNPNYWEDVDLCFQARRRGFIVAVADDVGILHEDHAPTTKHALESRQHFIAKWKNVQW